MDKQLRTAAGMHVGANAAQAVPNAKLTDLGEVPEEADDKLPTSLQSTAGGYRSFWKEET